MKRSGATTVVSLRASNPGNAAPATAAPTMSSSACGTSTHLAPSPDSTFRGGGEGGGKNTFRVRKEYIPHEDLEEFAFTAR